MLLTYLLYISNDRSKKEISSIKEESFTIKAVIIDNIDDYLETHYLGSTQDIIQKNLSLIQERSADTIIKKIIPKNMANKPVKHDSIFLQNPDRLLSSFSKENHIYPNLIGQGYYESILPAVIKTNVLENQEWYTPILQHDELNQGKLEILFTFQRMIIDLTKMEVSGIGLPDESTACAESMIQMYKLNKDKRKNTILIDHNCHPHNIAVARTYAYGLNIDVVIGNPKILIKKYKGKFFGLILQYPGTNGELLLHIEKIIQLTHMDNALVSVSADLMALTLLKPPGEMKADIAFGSIQRFGISLGFGGPSGAYFACQKQYQEHLPTHIVSPTKDSLGKSAWQLRTAQQTHHPSVITIITATLYAMYHGYEGIKKIANNIYSMARFASGCVTDIKYMQINKYFFDTISFVNYHTSYTMNKKNFHVVIPELYLQEHKMTIAINEKTSTKDIVSLFSSLINPTGNTLNPASLHITDIYKNLPIGIPKKLRRRSQFFTHAVFLKYRTDREMERYLYKMIKKDMTLQRSMLSMSTTPKPNLNLDRLWLNAHFSDIHPLIPVFSEKNLSTHVGYTKLLTQLNIFLCELTKFDFFFLSSNTELQTEYAALITIRDFYLKNKTQKKDICLTYNIWTPTKRSIQLSGFKEIPLLCDRFNTININDLKQHIKRYNNRIAALYVNFPALHQAIDKKIKHIFHLIHQAGGQVFINASHASDFIEYIDFAELGADICQINLGKVCQIPDTINSNMCVLGTKKHLQTYLPKHYSYYINTPHLIFKNLFCSKQKKDILPFSQITNSMYGSGSLLSTAWAYMLYMGRHNGFKKITSQAIINANYMARRLQKHFSILFMHEKKLVYNQFFLTFLLPKEINITIYDVAKRLIDYGLNPPKILQNYHNTFLIEAKPNDTQEELDHLCDALIHIHDEIQNILKEKNVSITNNPVKNAPHTIDLLLDQNWNFPYSKNKAFFPLPWTQKKKYWPPIGKILNPDQPIYPPDHTQ